MLPEPQIRRALTHISWHYESGSHHLNSERDKSGWELDFESEKLVFRKSLRCQAVHPSPKLLPPESWEPPVTWDEINANVHASSLNRFLDVFAPVIAALPKGNNIRFTELGYADILALPEHYIFQHGQQTKFYINELLGLPSWVLPSERADIPLSAITSELVNPANLNFFSFTFGERKKAPSYAPDSAEQYLRPYNVEVELRLAARALDESRIVETNKMIDAQQELVRTIQAVLKPDLAQDNICGTTNNRLLQDQFIFVLKGDHPHPSLVDTFLFDGAATSTPHIFSLLSQITGVRMEDAQWDYTKHAARGSLDQFLGTSDADLLKRPDATITDRCVLRAEHGDITVTEGSGRFGKEWMISVPADNLALLRELNNRLLHIDRSHS